MKILAWLQENILLVIACFLVVFIPLFPKIPFFSPIETYIVRVRVEDILVLLATIIWLIKSFKEKLKWWRSPVSWFIFAYAFIGLLSVISAFFVIDTVPLLTDHMLKTILHYWRYLEYFTLFFIVQSAIKSRQDLKIMLFVLLTAVSLVGVYGIGQKYLYWPVYSTMNREFSKGIRLYLTEHARVQSTFAGHYDLAAWLVIVLPILLAVGLTAKDKWLRWLFYGVQLLGAWLMIMTASRTSFAAYFVSTFIVMALLSWRREIIKERWLWLISHFAGLWLSIFILMSFFGGDILDRFGQALVPYPTIHQAFQLGITTEQKLVAGIKSTLKYEYHPSAPPENSISTDEAVAVIVASDQRPISQKPSDVFVDVPDKVEVATISATGEKTTVIVEQPRVWSANALEHGLSLAIRLDSLWPRAIQGFLRNPFFGSGYATLNKTSLTEFTIADGTDNNFLRTLGETGLLGFIAFYGAIVMSIVIASKNVFQKDPLWSALAIGYLASAVGILLNATYIDVFAASKVAFTFWAMTGLLIGYDQLKHHYEKNS